MARMSIDDKICRDPRITVLAATLGWSRRETVGCLMLDVWPLCYDQETHLISERLIDAAVGHPGFAVAMLDSELASRDRSGKLLIRGAKERIEYLSHKKKAGREGGLKSAEVRGKGPKQTSSNRGSTPQAAGNPSVPDSAPDPVPDSAPVPVPVSVSVPVSVHTEGGPPTAGPLTLSHPAPKVRPPRKPKAQQEPKTPPAHQAAIDHFHTRYKAAYGTKPSWTDQEVGQVSTLVKKVGEAEVRRRTDILFDSPPSWLQGPYDVGTLVKHFNKLVAGLVTDGRHGRVEPVPHADFEDEIDVFAPKATDPPEHGDEDVEASSV